MPFTRKLGRHAKHDPLRRSFSFFPHFFEEVTANGSTLRGFFHCAWLLLVARQVRLSDEVLRRLFLFVLAVLDLLFGEGLDLVRERGELLALSLGEQALLGARAAGEAAHV